MNGNGHDGGDGSTSVSRMDQRKLMVKAFLVAWCYVVFVGGWWICDDEYGNCRILKSWFPFLAVKSLRC